MTTREKTNWALMALAGACGIAAAWMQGGLVMALGAASGVLGGLAGINGYVANKGTTTPQSLMTQLASELKAADKKEPAK